MNSSDVILDDSDEENYDNMYCKIITTQLIQSFLISVEYIPTANSNEWTGILYDFVSCQVLVLISFFFQSWDNHPEVSEVIRGRSALPLLS